MFPKKVYLVSKKNVLQKPYMISLQFMIKGIFFATPTSIKPSKPLYLFITKCLPHILAWITNILFLMKPKKTWIYFRTTFLLQYQTILWTYTVRQYAFYQKKEYATLYLLEYNTVQSYTYASSSLVSHI